MKPPDPAEFRTAAKGLLMKNPGLLSRPNVALAADAEKPLPRIQTNNRELRDVSEDTLRALQIANDPPQLFVRGGMIVRVDRSESGRHFIQQLTDIHLRGHMTRAADFYRLAKSEGRQIREKAIPPPMDVARDILSLPPTAWRLPLLEAVMEAPFLRPDGSAVCQLGYDASTCCFLADSQLADFHVPDHPSADDIDGSVGLIDELLADFPFLDAASAANGRALLITPAVRRAIQGPVPVGLADAPSPGTGKSLLAEVVSLIHTGSSAAMKPAPVRDEEEWRKTLTAVIQAGQSVTVFDNIDHPLASPNLALAVTANTWTDRILGRTSLVTLPQQTIFVVTGNNILLGGDMGRRCYWIRMDAATAEPWRGRTFRHPDIRSWILENRGRLLSAILTLARAWFVGGCPKAQTPVLGSFESWCTVVGGILVVAGVPDFLGNLDDLYRQADPTLQQWEAFITLLYEKMPFHGFTVAEVGEMLRRDTELLGAVPEELGDIEKRDSFPRKLGRAFLRRQNRRHGPDELFLVRGDQLRGAARWIIKKGKA